VARYIERRENGRYWIINPPDIGPDGEEEGMGLECGPFFTRWGARFHLRVWG
jgi:hypothetical protein